jgi:hypothetical protein
VFFWGIFLELKVTNADGRFSRAIISPVHNNDMFVGRTGEIRPINQNSHPLIKIDNVTVIIIWGWAEPNQKFLLQPRFWQVPPIEFI